MENIELCKNEITPGKHICVVSTATLSKGNPAAGGSEGEQLSSVRAGSGAAGGANGTAEAGNI